MMMKNNKVARVKHRGGWLDLRRKGEVVGGKDLHRLAASIVILIRSLSSRETSGVCPHRL